MRLLLDMNLSHRWVGLLASAGVDAVHWWTVGAANAPDVEVAAYALAHELLLLTHDLDSRASLAPSVRAWPTVAKVGANDVRPRTIEHGADNAVSPKAVPV